MPFLHFTRDARGYENTYVMHAFRRHGRKRPRILYWFRTPANVKVGRAALDEDAIRAIEENNPGLEFDWTEILEARAEPPEKSDSGATLRRRPPGGLPTLQSSTRGERPAIEQMDRAPIRPEDAPRTPVPDTGIVAEIPTPSLESIEPAESQSLQEALPNSEDGPAREIADDLVPLPLWDEPPDLEHPHPESAAPPPLEGLVGPEGVARLRARAAELHARITERGGDPVHVAELRRYAERLDPDTWVTLDEARAGLEEFERRLEELRRLLGPRQRRSRRGGARRRKRSVGEPQPTDPPKEQD